MQLELVKVALNKKEDQPTGEKQPWKEEIGAMEQLFASLAGLRRRQTLLGKVAPPSFSLEIANPSDSEQIFFYVSFPRRYREAVEKQVHSFFPNAYIEPTPDYTIFRPGSAHAVTVLKLKHSQALPLATYEEMDVDPLNEITNALSKLQTKEEGAAVQLLMQPTTGDGWRTSGRQIAHQMQQGKQLKDVNASGLGDFAMDVGKGLMQALTTKSSAEQGALRSGQKEMVQLTPEEQDLVKAIEQKTKKAAFQVNIRLLSSAETQERADQILAQMENAFGQFERSDINYFTVRKRIRPKRVAFDYIMRTFNPRNSIILGVEELAGVFHFPISTTKTPKITWLKSGAAPPPPNIPHEGMILGYSDYRGTKTDVRLSPSDRRRHLYAIGQTGTGKSAFLEGMAKQDIKNGEGLCFIDPHGDAIDDILASVPEDRVEDVIHFDPSDVGRPFGLNMLEYSRPGRKDVCHKRNDQHL